MEIHLCGTVCEFCRRVFCTEHANPLFHGCHEESARKKRQQLVNALLPDRAPPKLKGLSDQQKKFLLEKAEKALAAKQQQGGGAGGAGAGAAKKKKKKK